MEVITSYLFPGPKGPSEARFNLNELTTTRITLRLYLPSVYPVADRHVQHCNFYDKIDLANAFYYFPIKPKSCHLLTFQLRNQYYRYCRMPFGLRQAPALLSALTTALAEYLRTRFDFVVGSSTIAPFSHLQAILQRWKSAGIQVNYKKSCLIPCRRQALGAIWTPDPLPYARTPSTGTRRPNHPTSAVPSVQASSGSHRAPHLRHTIRAQGSLRLGNGALPTLRPFFLTVFCVDYD